MNTTGQSGVALEIEDGRRRTELETGGEAAASEAGAMRPLTVSIIISNCNYARFLGEAIDSALGQTYTHTEVIVVDDGSTDNSRQVIESRGERVHAIFKANGGHVSALNAGFTASTGDLVLFLDSDDVLEPSAIETAVREWREETARILFPLEVVDKDGKPVGRKVGGQELPSPVLGSFGVGSPTSGNVFSRTALEKMLPIPEAVWTACPDIYLTAAGLFGDVKCLRQPLARYRVHGRNNLACGDPLAVIRNRIELDFKLHDSLVRLTGGKIGSLEEWIDGCPQHWVRRIVSRRESPRDDPWQDSVPRLTLKAIRATWRQPQRNFRRRLAYSIFAVAYSTLPRKSFRFLQEIDGGSRGRTFRSLLGTSNQRQRSTSPSPMPRRNSLFNDYLYLAHRLDRQKAAKFCKKLGPKVLDLGCGYRPYEDLLPKGTVCLGMDGDAARRPDLAGSCMAIPVKDEAFDSVMCNHVIEHVPRPWVALEEICRVLKPGGLLYLTVPQTWGLHYEPHDFYRYTKYGLAYLLKEAGFDLMECEPMGGLFTLIAIRLIDLAVLNALFPVLRRMGLRRGQYRLGAMLFLPATLLAIPCTTLLDRFDTMNQYAWAVLARRLPEKQGTHENPVHH